jgi:hypothetical protein
MQLNYSKHSFYFVLLFSLLLIGGCSKKTSIPPVSRSVLPSSELSRVGYTIQAGAFSNIENAIRFTDSLQRKGLNAYYYISKKRLYKVRFGNFYTEKAARKKAETLRAKGIIKDYYITSPDSYAAARKLGTQNLREEIVRTAMSFIGIPYRWGGASSDYGFDCSGLTMAVYQLNGLDLPRSSREQWRRGRAVEKSSLLRGDLVFFAISGMSKVSHVGIYAGGDKFIHAPRRGKRIKVESLSKRYFKRRYVGARTFL